MKYRYGKHSQKELRPVHPWLGKIAYKTLETDDHKVLTGGRSVKKQQAVFDSGHSKLAPPKGKHLIQPDGFAYAIDVVPYIKGKPLATDAKNFGSAQQAQFAWFLRKFYENGKEILAEVNKDLPKEKQWALRFGNNWNMDSEILTDQDFDDWFHIELIWGLLYA